MKRVLFLTVVAVLALCGAAYAGGQITGNSIKDSSITGKDIKNRSLTPKDFKGSVRGPAGPQGIQGLRGPAGPAGVNTVIASLGDTQFLCPAGGPDIDCTVGVSEATCPAGMVATGGGFEYENEPLVASSVPLSSSNLDGTGWIVGIVNQAGITGDFYAVAHCAYGTYAGAVGTGVSQAQAVRQLKRQARTLAK